MCVCRAPVSPTPHTRALSSSSDSRCLHRGRASVGTVDRSFFPLESSFFVCARLGTTKTPRGVSSSFPFSCYFRARGGSCIYEPRCCAPPLPSDGDDGGARRRSVAHRWKGVRRRRREETPSTKTSPEIHGQDYVQEEAGKADFNGSSLGEEL